MELNPNFMNSLQICKFTDEIIPDKFPENISDNFNLSSSHSNQTSQLDYSNLLDEESKSKEETENYDDLQITTNEESELNLGDVLFPPKKSISGKHY